MIRNRRTLTIDSIVYEKFKVFCDQNNLKISRHAEKILLDYIKEMEKKGEARK